MTKRIPTRIVSHLRSAGRADWVGSFLSLTTKSRLSISFSVLVSLLCGLVFGLSICPTPSIAEELTTPSLLSPVEPIQGSLVICGGGILPAPVIDRFFELAGGEQANIVVISTASSLAGTPDMEDRYAHWKPRPHKTLTFFHTRDRKRADEEDFTKPLAEATGIWFAGGNQNWLAEAYLGTRVEEICHAALKRGAVLGGTSAGAAIISKTMIAGGRDMPVMASGFGLLPGTIIDQHFRKRNRTPRLLEALKLHPGLVGIGIDEGTALVVRGRTLEVLGDSDVQLALGASRTRESRVQPLPVGQKEDLVKLSRAAVARVREPLFTVTRPTEVQSGTLVIVGGGPTPREAVTRFLSAAGGKEAPIVVVSNAMGEQPPEAKSVCGWLEKAGAMNVCQVHTRNRSDFAAKEIVDRLTSARGIWFTGGRQWRLVDAYLDTPVQKLFVEVLSRGGVIGGTSAGATIQGEYLVRGNPLGNEEMMTEGYERGFGFLPGVAIDQHFTQRKRFDDMTELKKSFPALIGLGVDEATALIVHGSTMEVVGQNQVAVFDRQPNDPETEPEFEVIKAGQKYDFKTRRRLEESLSTAATTKSE